MPDFLFELGTEELPPKSLHPLSRVLHDSVCAQLQKLGLSFADSEYYATPRRLAFIIKDLADKQADSVVERRGPALKAAFNDKGEPTPACLGFAKSCQVSVDELERLETEKADIADAQEEVMAEAKSRGYDTKVLRKVIALRKRDADDIAEEEAVMEMYKEALGM